MYHDEDGKLHKFAATCTHLGCVVAWKNDPEVGSSILGEVELSTSRVECG